ncbi:hypothetical protein VK792_05725 [Mesobacterium sp. TK19101]|uniref:Uncharacterized protein n=1 Tax=Mesobacterium hydrothermale TaxID=3111907 RepID=A0ABU6HEG5_9RHOB|nr:hypothetical protein [Mesobacterium sp. TK19101]MEC3860776.1 hypothetical protein [Mesobacterium sp. TK19101]
MRLFRLIIFVAIAFVVGMFFERSQQMDRCETAGGVWTRANVCAGAREQDG